AGCSQYCQTAGGYGGSPRGRPVGILLTPGIRVTAGSRLIPIERRCNVPWECRGALLLDGPPAPRSAGNFTDLGTFARSDLVVPAGEVRTIGVPMTSFGRGTLESRRRV